METILEYTIELAEKVWLRLDIFLGLGDTQGLDFIKTLVTDILSDPFLLGLTVGSIALALYITFRVKKAYKEKEKRLDALLQELDETEADDEFDFDNPLFANQTLEASGFDKTATDPLSDPKEVAPVSEAYGNEFESLSSDKQITAQELSQTHQEPMANDFDWDSTIEEWDELYDSFSERLQEVETTSNLEKKSTEPPQEEEESEEVAEFLEAVSNLGKESSEMAPEEKKSDQELTANEATPSLLASEAMSPPAPERIELSLEEIEVEPESESDLLIETTFPEPPQPEPVATIYSASPLLKSMLNSSVSAKTDALVSRLKTFQAELETRFSSLGAEPETIEKAPATNPLRKKQSNYQPASVNYTGKRKSRSNKEYLNQLESFIFMAKQKN